MAQINVPLFRNYNKTRYFIPQPSAARCRRACHGRGASQGSNPELAAAILPSPGPGLRRYPRFLTPPSRERSHRLRPVLPRKTERLAAAVVVDQ